ncbi:unnamed protein product [Symbiodinium natans]|uniref:3-hydroxyisobutyryl-CoA hydrolase n=1 Tax=Symbiodinium natans TaxID=878477 RepID=A0A812RQL8_9DINO|nr:unnamed protein product [Symbiodinium natans]
MDDPALQANILERSNVGMGMLVLNRAEGLDLPSVNELYKRLRNLEVNSLKRFVGLTAAQEFRSKADAARDESFQSSLEKEEKQSPFATGRFCIGLDPKELLLAAVYAQKHGDLAPFSKALLWNSQELAYLAADYRKPLVCHLSGAAWDGGAALAGLSSFSGAHHTSEISVRSCFQGLVPMGGMTALLASLKWHLGEFLALTGWTLRGSDLVALGLIRHWMSPDALPFLELTAEKQLEVSESDAALLLTEHSLPLPEDTSLLSDDPYAPGFKRSYIPLIAEIFSKESLPKIVEALDHRINNPETSHMDGEFLEVCKDRLSQVDKRAAWMTQTLIRRVRVSASEQPATSGRLNSSVLLEALRAELWAETQLLTRQETIWGLHAACTGTTYRFGDEEVLVGEVDEASTPPKDFVFSIPERPEMPLSQHPRLRRYHPDYDSATGLDHDPLWMQQEVRRWDPQVFDLERRHAVEARG